MTMIKQTDEARAIADAAPVIDVSEVGAELEPAAKTSTVHQHGDQERSRIEEAADLAINLPGVPGRDEFLSLAMQARILSLSAAAPEAVRNNPHLAFHVAMIGRDLGISPSAALEQIDVIAGKKGPQLSLSPQLLAGQVRRLGLGSIRPITRSAEACVAGAYGPDGTLLGESEFTWEDAQMAGLAGPDCRPTEHSNACKAWTKGQTCNQGYKSYPKRMMWWRAAGFAVDDFFPEAGLGLYSPEELGAVVDDTGRPIDPTTVELPSGYEKQATAAEREAERQAEAARVATDDEKAALSEKIEAMPPPAVQALAAAWSAPTEDKYEDGTPVPFLLPRRLLPIGQLKKANALVDSILARAKRGEFGTWVGHEATTFDDDKEGHLAPLTRIPDRVAARIREWAADLPVDECWTWPLSTNAYGYGQLGWKEDGVEAKVTGHRLAWSVLVGPIPEDLVLDHLCHNAAVERGECNGGDSCPHRSCWNPAHLKPETNEVNAAAPAGTNRDTCAAGLHPWPSSAIKNGTGTDGKPSVTCGPCQRARKATTSPDSPQDAPETSSGPDGAPTPPEDDEDELCECGALATFFTDDGLPVCDKHTPEDQA